ncbi:MAG: SIR2 family protein [Caldilineaceae bacterium]
MQIDLPIELLEQFQRDNVLLFIGEGINRGVLPQLAELSEELAQRCDYPANESTIFQRVAGYYEFVHDRNSLITFLRERFDRPNLHPARAHQLVARLKPRTIVTTCYDLLLGEALRQANLPYIPVVRNTDIVFAEERKTLLVWLWGILEQPDSLVLTEDDHRLFLENRGNLSDVLRGELARRTWLFLGFDLEDDGFRDFYDTVQRSLDRFNRRAYVFGATPGAYTRLWWEKRNVSVLDVGITLFLEVLATRLNEVEAPVQSSGSNSGERRTLLILSSPYKGLDFYSEQDADAFFGRGQEIEKLAGLIHAHRLVLLYGASGMGKTSLLQAGVIPRLKQHEPGYAVIIVRAVEDIRTSLRNMLARQLTEIALPETDTLVQLFARVIQVWGPTVLIVDQFEEFFIYGDSSTRAQVIDALAQLYAAQDLPVKIVFCLREDYLARMGELEQRIPSLFHNRFQLLPFTPEQARQVIINSASAAGKRYEPMLVNLLLDDLTDEVIMPPQVQIVCRALYDQLPSGEQQITVAMYEKLGSAVGILKTYLSGELSRMDGPERTLARSILKELIDSKHNRIARTETDLIEALGAPREQLKVVLEKLVRAHLLRLLDLEQRDATGYELAHEYLIDEIVQWFDPRESERKRVYELLHQDRERWQQFGTPIPSATLDMLKTHWGEMLLQPDDQKLVLQSAIVLDWHTEEWVKQLWTISGSLELLTELLHSPDQVCRATATKAWRVIPTETQADTELAQLALHDSNHKVRTEAAITLARRNPQLGVDSILQINEPNSIKRMEALAQIWDEAGALRQLPFKLYWQTAFVLARLRLTRSGQLLLYQISASMIGGIAIGLLFALVGGVVDWFAFKSQWIQSGSTVGSVIGDWLVAMPWTVLLGIILLILSSSIPLIVDRDSSRLFILGMSALLTGLTWSLLAVPLYVWDFFAGTLWQAAFTYFVGGGILGICTAELLYRRQQLGEMPSPLLGGILGAAGGFVIGLVTAFSPATRLEFFPFWLLGQTLASMILIGGISFTLRSADNLIYRLSFEKGK